MMGSNAQLIGLAQKNAEFAEALRAADLNVADGISVVMAARLTGQPLQERVTGGDLMERLCGEAAVHGYSVYFLGGLPWAAELAAEKLQKRYPGLRIAGTDCPPMGFEQDPQETERILKKLRWARPALLCVALGAPKQELWMHRHREQLPVRAVLSVGAALDTQAGLRRRAPRWSQRMGVEWLYRLLAEPKRLWRRYLLGNSYFIYLIGKQLLLRQRKPSPSA